MPGVVPGQPANALSVPEHVQAGIGGDTVEPGRDVEFGIGAAKVLVGADETFLGQVEGIIRVAHHPIGERVDLPLVALD